MTAGPVSRILSVALRRQDGHSSRRFVTEPLKRPTRDFHPIAGSRSTVGAPSRHALALLPCCPLFGLAPCGVYHASSITGRAVRSYRTFSPLPFRAVCSLWHWPSLGLDPEVPDVIRHTALRSSDFPRLAARPSGPAVNLSMIADSCEARK